MKCFILLLLAVTFKYSNAIKCLECFGVSTDAECAAKGRIRTCRFNQDACEIELREHEGWGGHVLMYKQCKQSKACDNNHVQNPRSAWEPSQCNPEDFNSVCRCCCYDDLCNVARDNCFGTPGCARMPNSIHRGAISCTNGSEPGSSCTVTCDSSAKLDGVGTIYCRYDGSWSYPLGQCLDIQCSQRVTLANGWFGCTNSLYVGSSCTAFCRPGFRLVGPEVSTCLNTGQWNYLRQPYCEPLVCPNRGRVAGGIVTCSNENNIESRCNVTCEGNRRLVGITDSYCQDDGTWSHSLPKCELIQCPVRGTLVYGSVSCTDGVEVSSTCLVTCDPGYSADSNVDSVCLPNGQWDNPLPRCIRVQCPKRGTIKNGGVSCTDSVFVGSLCTAICNSGSRLVGLSDSECLPTGDWSYPLPRCQTVLCPVRGVVAYGKVVCTKGQYVTSRCRVMCDTGTEVVGQRDSDCLPDGSWSYPLPECQRIRCRDLDFSTQPGSMFCSDDFYYASSCSFKCDTGLKIVGSPRLRCNLNGLWNTKEPTCEPINCRIRNRLIHGEVVCTNSNQVESFCSATCLDGYTLVGNPESTCNLNGKWSNNLPTCRPIFCRFRGSVVGGSVSCTNENVYGSVCKVRCNSGRDLTGEPLSSCLATGVWSTPLPTCLGRPCPDQGVLAHGSITCTDDWNVNSACTFRCQGEGYELYPSGRGKNVCRPNQLWTLPKPCCTRPCPPYAVMDIVIVLDSSSSIGAPNWVQLTAFVKKIISSFIVAEDAANFAIFRYNKFIDTDTQIFLNSHPGNLEQLLESFDKIPYDGSGTFTGQALQHAVDASLLVANGNRPGVKDIVFVITDGKAADDVKTPADELRKMGATVLVLGVVPPKGSLDLGQLRDIAGGDRNLVIAEGGFAGLSGEFGLKLSRTICGEPCK